MMKLVLFDIDGTLLTCGPQVRPLFASALVEVFGTAGEVDAFDFTGRTDPGIVLDLITGAGLSEALVRERLPRVRALYTERLDRALDRRGMGLPPCVAAIVER